LISTSPVKAGQVLAGKYRIERLLGEGGMGVIVEAYDVSLERRVAIKFLLPEFAAHPEATQRFMREARAAAKIQSEHVARVIDVSTLETGAPYMVMEFLEGSDLSQVIDANGALPMEDAALYLIQACEALAEAHAYGIIHRDLKPANLFLAQQAGGSRKIKVLDFGISKTLSATDPGLLGSLTQTSAMLGSPLYMSPEQMKSSRDVDYRTDIWALGIILYEVLTADTPFTGSSIPELSAKILLEEPRLVSDIKPEIPEALAAVVVRALRKQPEMRFANVGELAMALLPFAPNRARNNVERIIRVLNMAGIAQAEFVASVLPQEQGQAIQILEIKHLAPASAGLLRWSGKKKHVTLANFGQTQTERAPARRSELSRRWIAAAAGSMLTVLGVATLVLRSNPSSSDTPSGVDAPLPVAASSVQSGVAASAASVAPSAPASALLEEAQPLKAPSGAGGDARANATLTSGRTEPTPVAASQNPLDMAEAPSTPAPAGPGPSKVSATSAAARGSVRTTRRASGAAQPALQSAVSKPRPKTYAGAFNSKFGSRK
jgi:serine/threonine protein kinase